jgi:hypothetical protein
LFEAYAALFPRISRNPLFHNDTFFISQLPGWDAQSVQETVNRAKSHNETLG